MRQAARPQPPGGCDFPWWWRLFPPLGHGDGSSGTRGRFSCPYGRDPDPWWGIIPPL